MYRFDIKGLGPDAPEDAAGIRSASKYRKFFIFKRRNYSCQSKWLEKHFKSSSGTDSGGRGGRNSAKSHRYWRIFSRRSGFSLLSLGRTQATACRSGRSQLLAAPRQNFSRCMSPFTCGTALEWLQVIIMFTGN